MELRQLEYLAAVARHRSFTRAADELYVTQPALSQQVRRLEAELGLALLLRTPGGVELTPAGAEFVEHAEAILGRVGRARAAMEEHVGGVRGIARIAATPGDGTLLPEALAAFHARHPAVRVSLRQAGGAEVVALLATGAVDLAVAALGDEARARAADLPSVTLREEALRIVSAPGDPLTAGGPRPIEDLRGLALVLADRGSALRDAVVGACAAAGFSPVPLFEAGDPGTLRRLVAAGLGVSVVPASWPAQPGPALDAVALTGAAPVHRVELLAAAAGMTPAGRLVHEHLLVALS